MYYQIPDTDNKFITALSLAAGFGSAGDWLIYENDGESELFFFLWFRSVDFYS